MRIDYATVAPELFLSGAICVILIVDLALRGASRVLTGVMALVATVIAGVLLVPLIGTTPRTTLSGMFVLDGFALTFKFLFAAVGALVILLSIEYMRGHRYEGEYYVLVLASILGTMLMPSSRDLLMLFISLELVSVPAFVIAGLRKHDPRSNEAALKFFLFGVLSAGVLAYGISLIYGFTGATGLTAIGGKVAGLPSASQPLLLFSVVLLVAAFGFKVSAVPFHFWAPDTYEGSPAPLAAFLSVGSKAAGFAGLALILVLGVQGLASGWVGLVAVISALTMTVGNLLALRQRQLIRLLAYSGVAQAGYMLIPLAVVIPGAAGGPARNAGHVLSSLLLYLMIYSAMNLGAFAVAIGIAKQHPTLLIRDLAGLGRRAPFTAAAMTAFLLSLGGIPPLAGWAAKFFVFLAAVDSGSRRGVLLAAIMVVNSVISLYYYVGVARTMYLQEPEDPARLAMPRLVSVVVGICLAAVVALGVYPEAFVRIARAAVLQP